MKVVEYVDKILLTGSAEDKRQLKRKFGLEGVEHDDDFARLVSTYLLQGGGTG